MKYSFAFDVAAVELLAPLLAGGRIVVTPNGRESDGAFLAGLIARERVTVLDVVPSLLKLLLDQPGPAAPAPRCCLAGCRD